MTSPSFNLLDLPVLRVTSSERSMTSSIFDMTPEAEEVERAVRDGDMRTLRKFLQLHFPLQRDQSFRSLPVHTEARGSAMSSQHRDAPKSDSDYSDVLRDDSSGTHHSKDFLSVPPTTLQVMSLPNSLSSSPKSQRSSSVFTGDHSTSSQFCNLLHLAVFFDNPDALRLMLEHKLNPNEPGFQATDAHDDVIHFVLRKPVRGSGGEVCGEQSRLSCTDACQPRRFASMHALRLSAISERSSKPHCTGCNQLETWRCALNRSACQASNASSKKTTVCSCADTKRRTCNVKPCFPVFLPVAGSLINAASALSCCSLATLPPLFLAASLRRHNCAELLLEHGAAVDIVDIETGLTPLLCALIGRKDSSEKFDDLLEVLFKHGASLVSVTQHHLSEDVLRVQEIFDNVVQQSISSLQQAAFSRVTPPLPVEERPLLGLYRCSRLRTQVSQWRSAAQKRPHLRRLLDQGDVTLSEEHQEAVSLLSRASKKSKRPAASRTPSPRPPETSDVTTKNHSDVAMDRRDASIERASIHYFYLSGKQLCDPVFTMTSQNRHVLNICCRIL